ncbi:hypothetical protein EIP91_009338 [Steccherinum ochraceum]|uniref:Uncharacterized protein n=1 Tax=Steccherinum ochraceum TaxID=92696 RepID=A0A4R0RXQ3_9APHY|nr:hypothetical protein EIP91_009338 [Steccherinum ochraceum]
MDSPGNHAELYPEEDIETTLQRAQTVLDAHKLWLIAQAKENTTETAEDRAIAARARAEATRIRAEEAKVRADEAEVRAETAKVKAETAKVRADAIVAAVDADEKEWLERLQRRVEECEKSSQRADEILEVSPGPPTVSLIKF